jgi:hypothetical protein
MATKKEYEFALPDHPIEYGVLMALKDISVDPQAQRSVVPSRAQKIADNFIPGAVGQLTVNVREDKTSIKVCDGAHRKWALELLGIEKAWCEVHYGLSVTEEAMLFLIKNKESAQVNPKDMYHVGLTAGIRQYVHTEAVLKDHALKVGNASANQVAAVNSVVKIVEDYGKPTLDRVLSVAEGAWNRTQETWDAGLLGGLGQFIGRHPEADDVLLIKKLAKGGNASQFKGKIAMAAASAGLSTVGGGGRVNVAYMAIKDRYNAGRRASTRIQ